MQRPLTTFAILIALITAWLTPQLSGAETFSTTVKLEQPKKKAKRGEGGLNELLMDVWLPEDVKVVRGLLVNPFYRKATGQEHWQAACRQWDFGILAANYFAVRSSEFKPSLIQGLQQLAKESGHAELEHAPFLFVGMSAGAGMSTRLTELFPQRTIAAGPVALEVGPRDAASGKVPMITIFGERDGRQMEKLLVKLPAVRSEFDAQFAIAPQWRRRHEFYKANNLLMPLFDRVIAHRYPQDASPADGPVKLRGYKVTGGWLGDVSTWESQWARIAPYDEYQGDPSKACWFPDSYVAATWRSFVSKEPVVKLKSPPGQGGGQEFIHHLPGSSVTVTATVSKGIEVKKLEAYAGDQRLGELTGSPATFELKDVQPGIHALHVVATLSDGSRSSSRPNTIIVAREK